MENTFTSEDEPKRVCGENSVRRKVRTAKTPYGEKSYGENSHGEKSYGEKSWHRSKVSISVRIT